MMTEINKDIYRQEQTRCLPAREKPKETKAQGNDNRTESPPIKPVACSKCLMDNDDIWFSKV